MTMAMAYDIVNFRRWDIFSLQFNK